MKRDGLTYKQRAKLIEEQKDYIEGKQKLVYLDLYYSLPLKVRIIAWYKGVRKYKKLRVPRAYKVIFVKNIRGCPSPMELMQLYEQSARKA